MFGPDGEAASWYWSASDIRVPTLWDAVRAAGGRSAAVGWPLTAGGAIDWCMPELWPGGGEAAAIEAMRAATRPEGLWEEVEREATGRLRPEVFGNYRITSADRIGDIGAYLFERYRPMLLLLRTQPTTQVMQKPGPWSHPAKRRAVAASDRAVGKLLETVERLRLCERTAIIVAGDHGMMPVHTQIRPNVWLVEAGLRPQNATPGSWRASFHAQGGAAFLRVSQPVAENEAAVRRLLDALPRGIRKNFRVIDRPELNALGAYPEAPLALSAAPGLSFGEAAEGPVFSPNPGMTHGHHPDHLEMHTGLVAAGAGIRPGAVAPLLFLEDIAPLAAALLGIDFAAPDGVYLSGLLVD